MKADSTIRRELAALRRECIEGSTDPVERRVAQAIETAVRWARHDVRGWPSLRDEARLMARFIRDGT